MRIFAFWAVFLVGALLHADTLTLFVAGDTHFGWGAQSYYENRAVNDSSALLYELPWLHIKDIVAGNSISMLNLETSVTDTGTLVEKKFNFKMKPEFAMMLKTGGIDLVSLANNHTMDYSYEGLENTISTLDSYGIGHFGAGSNIYDAVKPVIIEREGLRIAFTGFSQIGPPGIFATENRGGTAGGYDYNKILKMAQYVFDTYRDSFDMIFAFVHWGKERADTLTYSQKKLGKKLIDMGFEGVIGAHSHNIQGIENYKGKYIFYSLGNFIFGGNDYDPEYTMGIKLYITEDGVRGYDIIPFRVLPYRTSYSPYVAGEDVKKNILERIRDFPLK